MKPKQIIVIGLTLVVMSTACTEAKMLEEPHSADVSTVVNAPATLGLEQFHTETDSPREEFMELSAPRVSGGQISNVSAQMVSFRWNKI